jgi:lipoate-protein ligase A
MKLYILKTNDPYYNLAFEEYLFSETDDDVFMLWQNEPCVVIGKNQNAYAEVNIDKAKESGIKIVRRITGGGAVYHDLGNVNYTFISSRKAEGGIDFAYFTEPIIEALASMGIAAELSGRNDLLAEGKKFSGNAQHSSGTRTLHHGTLLYNSDLSVLSSVLNVDEEKIRSKGIKSTRSRVINLSELVADKTDVDGFIELVARFVEAKYEIQRSEPPQDEKIAKLRERNASAEWIFPDRELVSRYSVRKKRRYDFGIVDIYLDMSNEIIKDVKISGDFFGQKPLAELESRLVGLKCDTVFETVSKLELGEYIFGMTASVFAEQILEKI